MSPDRKGGYEPPEHSLPFNAEQDLPTRLFPHEILRRARSVIPLRKTIPVGAIRLTDVVVDDRISESIGDDATPDIAVREEADPEERIGYAVITGASEVARLQRATIPGITVSAAVYTDQPNQTTSLTEEEMLYLRLADLSSAPRVRSANLAYLLPRLFALSGIEETEQYRRTGLEGKRMLIQEAFSLIRHNSLKAIRITPEEKKTAERWSMEVAAICDLRPEYLTNLLEAFSNAEKSLIDKLKNPQLAKRDGIATHGLITEEILQLIVRAFPKEGEAINPSLQRVLAQIIEQDQLVLKDVKTLVTTVTQLFGENDISPDITDEELLAKLNDWGLSSPTSDPLPPALYIQARLRTHPYVNREFIYGIAQELSIPPRQVEQIIINLKRRG